jgi:hypothetical protein
MMPSRFMFAAVIVSVLKIFHCGQVARIARYYGRRSFTTCAVSSLFRQVD